MQNLLDTKTEAQPFAFQAVNECDKQTGVSDQQFWDGRNPKTLV